MKKERDLKIKINLKNKWFFKNKKSYIKRVL